MDEKRRKTLQTMYRNACNNYLEAFAEKHGFGMEDCEWVCDDPGGIATVGDYYVGMQTLTDDIDLDAPEAEFLRWYDYDLSCTELGLPSCNFRSWLAGCPRHSDDTFSRLRTLRQEVDDARIRLETAIEEEKQKLF